MIGCDAISWNVISQFYIVVQSYLILVVGFLRKKKTKQKKYVQARKYDITSNGNILVDLTSNTDTITWEHEALLNVTSILFASRKIAILRKMHAS